MITVKNKRYVDTNHPNFEAYLISAASKGNWSKIDIDNIPKDFVTKELHSHPWYDPILKININLVTLAIVEEKTKEFPISLFSQRALTTPDKTGMTAIHYAGKLGQLKYIPKEFLTKENLCITSKDKTTPLQYAIYSRSYSQIPKELKTPELLNIKNNDGFCGLDFALFGLEEPKNWIMSTTAKERGLKEAKAQIKDILDTLDSETLKAFANNGTPSIPKPRDLDSWGAKWGIYPDFEQVEKQKREYSKKALLERKMKQSLSKNEKSIEI